MARILSDDDVFGTDAAPAAPAKASRVLTDDDVFGAEAAPKSKPAPAPAPEIGALPDVAPAPQMTDIEAAEAKGPSFGESKVGKIASRVGGALSALMGPSRSAGPAATTGLYETPTGTAPGKPTPAPIKMPGSVLDNMPGPSGGADIAAVGGPASQAFVDETRRAMEGMTPTQRQQVAALPGMRGAVARKILEGWAQADASVSPAIRTGTNRAEDIAARREQQGASRDVAEGMARVQNTLGIDAGPLSQAVPSEFDFDARQEWKDSSAAARGLEKGRVLIGKQFTGAARFISDVLGTELVSERLGQEGDRMARYVEGMGESKDFLVRNFENAVASTLSNVPALAFGVMTGSSVPTLVAMGLQVFGEEYNTGRQKGLDGADATTRAAIMGSAEIIGEQFGLGSLLKGLRAAADGVATPQLARFFAQHMLREIPGEQLTTAIQFGTDKFASFGLNKQATFEDYLGQVADTFAATVMQGAMTSGGGIAGGAGIRRLKTGSAQWEPLPEQEPMIPGALPLAPDIAQAVADKPATRALLTTPIVQAQEGSPYAQPAGAVQGTIGVQAGALSQPDGGQSMGGTLPPIAETEPAIAEAAPTTQADSAGEVTDWTAESGPQNVTTGDGTRTSPIVVTAPEHLEQAEAQVNTDPTDAQKAAGNYSKAHVQFQGFNVSIENPKGSERTGVAADGTPWSTVMPNSYGYIKRTEGADGDQVDVYLGDKPDAPTVFVVDQIDPATGKFDEAKVMMGFPSIYAARQAYEAGFSDGQGKARMGAITTMPVEQFREWVRTGDTKAPVTYKPTAVSRKVEGGKVIAKPLTPAVVGDAGKGIVDGMYDMLWEKVQKGETKEAGQVSTVLQVADRIKKAGGTVTRENLPEIAAAVTKIKDEKKGAPMQAALHALVKQYAPPENTPKTEEAPAAPISASDAASVTADDFDALINEVQAERKKPTKARIIPTRAGVKVQALNEQVQPVEAPRAPRARRESGKQAAQQAAAGVKEGFAGLDALFGRKGTLGSGPAFDEDTWAKAKPHFEAAFREFVAAGKSLKEFVRYILDTYNDAIIPYLKRWHADHVADAQEPTDGQPQTAGDAGDRALEGAPPAEVREPAGERTTGEGGPDGGRDDAQRAGGPDRAGVPGDRGVGDGAGEVPVPARGARGQRGGATERGVQDDGGALPGSGPARDGLGGRVTVQHEPSREDFTITDLTRLGEGGQKTKYKQNVAAIRLLKDLDATGRAATADEQNVLARYVGWGGIPQAFDPDNKDWAKEFAELRSLLADDEYDAARQSTRYAHYTSQPIIVDGIYAALARFGFTGGKILEAGGGVGNFLGLMPAGLRPNSRVTLVERERIAAGIARHLYPNQNVQLQDFTSFQAANGYYDASIGNPPFGKTALTDESGRKHLSGLSIHNYFIAKEIDLLRPGGIQAVVVSNYFMDAGEDRARRYIGDRTRFLGAIRLPNNAFAKNANTEVTTDIVFLQKLPEAEWGSQATKKASAAWVEARKVDDPAGGDPFLLNAYYVEHPEMMLGKMGRFGTMYGPVQPALAARDGQDTTELLRRAVERLPKDVYTATADAGTKKVSDDLVEALQSPEVQEGGYFLRGETLYQRIEDEAGEARARLITPATQWSEKQSYGQPRIDRLKLLAKLRTTVRKLIAAESVGEGNPTQLRQLLNRQYDAYVKKHGYLNERGNVQLYGDDPDFPLLAALEHNFDPGVSKTAADKQGIKPVPPKADKAPIFTRRVIEPRKAVTKADTPADALVISLAERGHIDTAFIGKLLGRDGEEVLRELAEGDKPLLFVDPATREYTLRDAYLSGNVRKKLAEAIAAGMAQNARALEEVIPEDVPAHDITGRLGAHWIPTEVYEQFARDLLGDGTRATVVYVAADSSFLASFDAGSDVANRTIYGTKRMAGEDILFALINNREVKVYDTDADGKRHLNMEATQEAEDKARAIKDRFGDWLFSDPDRSERLVRAYNEVMNNYVTRQFDGSMMQFPGKVPDDVIKFRRHQRNAIARIVQDRTTLLDHVVGAGKTFTIVAGAMELKRTGLAKKSMVAVPNHLVKQWAADFYRLYPGANILTATKKDFKRQNRRQFLAKIATGDWDAVIIAHSSFGFIKPSPEFEEQFHKMQIAHVVTAIKALDKADKKDRLAKRTVKQLEAMKEQLEQRIKRLRDRPMDDLLDFGQLGVDQLFVDEAHLFKNLMFITKMQNVRGLGDAKGSQRAYDMLLKTRQIMAMNGRSQGVVFATGTPVSNSLAEMYHMMRYLQPETIEELGHGTFDAWANTFAEVEQTWMQSLSGTGFKASNRLGKFSNAHELLKIYDLVADTVTMEDIKAAFAEENPGKQFPIPPLKGGARQPVSIPISADQKAYMQTIAERAQAMAQRRGPPMKGDDNMLSIMTDARKNAMDVRLVRFDLTERDPNGRIAVAARNIVERYKQYDADRGTQLVFSDMGTPIKHAKKELVEYEGLKAKMAPLEDEELKTRADLGDEAAVAKIAEAEDAAAELEAKGSDWLGAIQAALRGFSIYDDLRQALIEQGIPENEIAFIHDYNTDDQKAALFRAVNAGKIRVVLGSTPKMGAGTNVQERLVALHHLDVPWKPSDVEQREGRIVRQGNKLAFDERGEPTGFEVEVLAYATQDTLDLFMWQTQENKLRMIGQLRTGQIGREIDNAFEELQMSAGEMQAAATSNPYLLEEIQLKDRVKRLERQKRSFDAQKNDLINRQRRAQERKQALPGEIKRAETFAKGAQDYLDSVQKWAADMKATVQGKEVVGRDAIGRAILQAVDSFTPPIADGLEGEALTKATKAAEDAGKKALKDKGVEFNGKVYKSASAVADAYRDLSGDKTAVSFTPAGGKTVLHRRSEIGKALEKAIAAAAETDSEIQIGTLGDVTLEAEFQRSAISRSAVVTISYKGVDEQVTVFAGNPEDDIEASKIAVNIVDRALGVISEAPRRPGWLKADLAKYERTLDDIGRQAPGGEFPGEADLTAARARHAELLKQLAEFGKEKPADAAPDENAAPPRMTRGEGFQYVRARNGEPILANEGIVLGYPRRRAGRPDVEYYLLDRDRLRQARALDEDPRDSAIGRVELEVDRSGRVTALNSIFLAPTAQRGGYGEKVLRAILAGMDDGAELRVANVLPESRAFWGKMGARLEPGRLFDDGYITRGSYERARTPIEVGAGSQGLVFKRGQEPEGAGPVDAGGTGGPRPGAEERLRQPPASRRRVTTESPADAGLRISRVHEALGDAPHRFSVPTRVYATAAEASRDLGFEMPDDIWGVHYKGQISLIAGNLADETAIEFTYWHENFHAGAEAIERAEGFKAFEDSLQRVAMANPTVKRAAFVWRERYADQEAQWLRDLGTPEIEIPRKVLLKSWEEAVADISGDNPNLRNLDRLIAALQTLLRKLHLDRLADWMEGKTNAEALALIRRARDAMTPEGALVLTGAAAPAMSRDYSPMPEEPEVPPALSRAPLLRRTAEAVGNLFQSDRTFNRWWHTTVGTQYHKATIDKHFKRVFDAGQAFLNDVSLFSMRAEASAPDILLSLENFGDVFKRRRMSQADNAKVGEAIFQGTLDDTVYSHDQLRTVFGFTEQQVNLYRQARGAINHSLDELTKSQFAKMAKAVGVSHGGVMAAKDEDLTLSEFFDRTQDLIDYRIAARELLNVNEQDDTTRQMREAEIKKMQEQKKALTRLFNRVAKLKMQGYAPLMRFGQYTVDVVDDQGERIYFGMYESNAEARREAAAFREEYPDASVRTGVLSMEQFRLFQGLTPETVALFAENAGFDQDAAFQEYLRLAVNNRSALKRLIHRKETPGFSTDVPRVLAQFVTSNARLASANYHVGEMMKAIDAIPKRKGDVRDEAMRLRQYLMNPMEEAAALRGFLFFNFIGGSVASAIVNATQPITMTAPYLTQFASDAVVAKEMARASMEAARNAPGADIADDYRRAKERGIIAPHEIHQLMAEARGAYSPTGMARLLGKQYGRAVSATHRVTKVWGGFFALAESFNRRTTFIAALRIARQNNHPDPFAFAEQTVYDTQGIYSKANRPRWARGPVGATVFCVDEKTEALTSEGWKTIDQVRPGDLFASFDMKTETLVWKQAKSIHRSEHDGDMVHVHHQSIDMLMTPDHRCVTYRRRRVPGKRAEGLTRRSLEIQEARDLVSADAIPAAAPFMHEPVGKPINDALVPVLGWVITEGCYYPEGYICIYQNEGRFADAIRSDLRSAGIDWTETSHEFENGNGKHTRFFINASRSRVIREILPKKELTPALLMRLSVPQIRVLVDKMIDGDGSVGSDGQRCFIQNEGPTLESFQMALTMLGISFSVRKHNGGRCKAVLLRKSTRHHVGRGSKETVQYKGRVWCPIIPETCTWVARRNGMPFITHNTFKQFSIAYVEWLKRLPGPQRMRALAILFLAAGLQGLPFAEDIEDIIDAIGQWLGYGTNTKKWIRQNAASWLGDGAGQFVTHGVSAFLPIDISARMGLGNLLPGTGLLKRSSTDKGRDIVEFLGPVGGVAEKIIKGKPDEALVPKAIQDAYKAYQMWTTGEYRNGDGQLIARDVTKGEAVAKGVGFNPDRIAVQGRKVWENSQDVRLVKDVESQITGKWAQGIVEKDPKKIAQAREELLDWNRKNPTMRIRIEKQQIQRRVSELRKTREERLIRRTSKELRGDVARDVKP